MHAMKLLKALVDYLLEEPNVEHISQPEAPALARKRFQAREYLRTQSPKWRDRRIVHETQSLQRSNHSSDQNDSRPVSL